MDFLNPATSKKKTVSLILQVKPEYLADTVWQTSQSRGLFIRNPFKYSAQVLIVCGMK